MIILSDDIIFRKAVIHLTHFLSTDSEFLHKMLFTQ